MEKRICPVCGGNRSEIIKRIDMKIPKDYGLPEHYHVVACSTCGMVYADTEASMEDYDYYYANCNFYGDDAKGDNFLRYQMTEEFLEKYCQKDFSMLNIGIGNGRFEAALKKNGYENITGIDPSVESVERLKDLGISSHLGNIYSPVSQEESKKYDCIFLFEVAEHLLVPKKGIENVKKMLKKDGIFMISVPDYSWIGKQTEYAVPAYFNLEHINYFSEVSLDNLMAPYGLHRISQKREGEDLIHCYKNVDEPEELRQDTVTRRSVCEYFAAQEGKSQKAAQIIKNLKETKREIAIWGTGSYAMSLMAATDLSQCHIKGFIDNNKIRQGRKMYGYQIFAPEFLIDKSYTVLICSMHNGEQIKEQITSMNTQNDVIIL